MQKNKKKQRKHILNSIKSQNPKLKKIFILFLSKHLKYINKKNPKKHGQNLYPILRSKYHHNLMLHTDQKVLPTSNDF